MVQHCGHDGPAYSGGSYVVNDGNPQLPILGETDPKVVLERSKIAFENANLCSRWADEDFENSGPGALTIKPFEGFPPLGR